MQFTALCGSCTVHCAGAPFQLLLLAEMKTTTDQEGEGKIQHFSFKWPFYFVAPESAQRNKNILKICSERNGNYNAVEVERGQPSAGPDMETQTSFQPLKPKEKRRRLWTSCSSWGSKLLPDFSVLTMADWWLEDWDRMAPGVTLHLQAQGESASTRWRLRFDLPNLRHAGRPDMWEAIRPLLVQFTGGLLAVSNTI